MKFSRVSGPGAAAVLMMCAVLLVSLLTGCSGSTAPMPRTATYIADLPAGPGGTMTVAITVEGDKVVAYATNGGDDEAYFFGSHEHGRMSLMSMYADTIEASVTGTNIEGALTMNEKVTVPMKFAAAPVAAPAGIYTADHGGSRASWVVRPNRTMVGVMDNSAPGDHKVTDALAAQDQAFRDEVRQTRIDRQMRPAPQMTYGTWSSQMHGSTVTAVRVTGDMSF